MASRADPRSSAQAHEDDDLRERAQALGLQMRAAVGGIFDELAERRARDQKALQAALRLSQPTISRLLAITRPENPLAVLAAMPGTELVAQLLEGARVARVSAPRRAALADAVSNFDEFVQGTLGDRVVYDAMLSEFLPESRAAFESRYRSRAFKLVSLLKGVRADLSISTSIVVPGEGGRLDLISLDVLRGCRRLKPSGELHYRMGKALEAAEIVETNLAGGPAHTLRDLLLPEFSTIDEEQILSTESGLFTDTVVTGLPLSKARSASGHDIVMVKVNRGVRRTREGKGAVVGSGGLAEPPTEDFVVDFWLHEEVWPNLHPEATIFDTTVRGVADILDPGRRRDRLPCDEPVQFLGRGPGAMALPEWPHYVELLAHACAARRIELATLRGFRLRVRYPMYGSQIQLSFTVPD